MDATTTGAVGAAVGAVIGAITPLFISWWKSRRETTKDDRDFAQATFDRMEKRICELERAERECLKTNAAMSQEVGGLRILVEELQRQVAELRRLEIEDEVGRTMAVVACDSNGIITSWSYGAESLLGWKSSEMVGKSVDVLVPIYMHDAHNTAFAKANKSSSHTLNVRIRDVSALHKNGHEIPVTIHLNSYHGPDGHKCFEARMCRR